MTNAKNSGIFWGKIKPENRIAIAQALARSATVIVNEAHFATIAGEMTPWTSMATDIKAINPNTKVVVSFNAYSTFVDTAGKPSVYFPIQCLIHKAATELNAWLKAPTGQIAWAMVGSQQVKSGTTWVFDIRVPAFRYRLADIINTALDSYPDIDGVHFDELHSTIRFLPYQGLPSDEEWTAANKSFLRMIDKPIMGNGTYDITKYHKTKSRGRYVQNETSIPHALEVLKSDLELPIKQRWSIVNVIGGLTVQQKADWARFSYGTGVGIQRYPSGVSENFGDYNIEQLSF